MDRSGFPVGPALPPLACGSLPAPGGRTCDGTTEQASRQHVGLMSDEPDELVRRGSALSRALRCPAELRAHRGHPCRRSVERVTGIEPASPAWKAGALPL